MELIKTNIIYNFILVAFIFGFGSCQNVSSTSVLNCGIIIRPDPVRKQETRLEGGDWPWLATVYRTGPWGLQESCVGTLVSLRAILTTASCLNEFENPRHIIVRLGQTNQNELNDRNVLSPEIKRILAVESNGVGVIELENNIVITDFVKPACLPTMGSTFSEEEHGFEAGWSNNIAYRTSARLHHHKSCSEDSPANELNTTFSVDHDSTIVCTSSAGAGLLIKHNGRWTLRGILSRECIKECEVYLDVANISDWLESNLPNSDATSILESETDVCGKSDLVETKSLYDPDYGTALKPHDWPWMAAIYYRHGRSLRMKCLGTLISSRTVLTSAGCANSTEDDHVGRYGWFVRLGQTNIAAPNQEAVKTAPILSFKIHPEKNVDIAIAILADKIRFTKHVRPACLFSGIVDSNETEYGFTVQWDSFNDQSGTRIAGRIWNETTCLQEMLYSEGINSATIRKKFCMGDGIGVDQFPNHPSAGSGVLVKRDDRWMIRGVVDFGATSLTDPYIVCSDVAHTIDWIKTVHSEIKDTDSTSLLLTATQSEDICGQIFPSFNFTRLAYAGFPIEKGAWPWLVAIFKNRNNASTFICGGTLISTKFIVTAAHCFYDRFGQLTHNDVMVYLGLHEINKTDDQGVISPSIKTISIHSDYNTGRQVSDADIAIITLREPITFTEYIRPACVWTDSDTSYNQIGSVVGWGRYETGAISEKPRQVFPRIVDTEECLHSHDAFSQISSKRSFCAGNRDNSGPCQGDSGGGLLIENQGRLYLRGIVSISLFHASATCDLAEYVVYSDVSKFIDWIANITTSENSS